MVETKIIKTTEKYGGDGKLVEKITEERTINTMPDGSWISGGRFAIPEVPKLKPGGSCCPKSEESVEQSDCDSEKESSKTFRCSIDTGAAREEIRKLRNETGHWPFRL